MMKISIIIPVYNSEKYLIECLNSLDNQMLDKLELIIINDGSTDNSKAILEDYEKNNHKKNIKIIHRANYGAGAARNEGLKYASGDYIGFVDSDDWVDPKMFTSLYAIAKTNDADIVCCGYTETYSNQTKQVQASFNKSNKFLSPVVLWNKIYKTSFWKQNRFSFSENIHHEDTELFPLIFSSTNKIEFLNNSFLYKYNCTNYESTSYKYGMHLESWKQIIINYIGYINEGKIHPDFHIVIYGIIIRLMLQYQPKDVIATFEKIYPILQYSETLSLSRKIILFFLLKSPNFAKKVLMLKVLLYSKLNLNG